MIYSFRQSWLNTYAMCPEQARLDLMGELPRVTTDAAAIGTSMHAGIEAKLKGEASTFTEGLEAARAEWDRLIPEIVWVQSKKPDTAWKWVAHTFRAWWDHVYPSIPGVQAIEHKFDVPLSFVGDDEIRLSGIIDLVDEDNRIWDWKTANQPYEQWEINRFKIQPTVYSYGWTGGAIEPDEYVDFVYAVMPKHANKLPQILHTKRGWAHWEWLIAQTQQIVSLIKADLDHWPLNDQGWWCSAKWCPAWKTCKGAYEGM